MPMASVDVSRMNMPPTSVWDSMHAPGVVSLLMLTNMFTEILGLRDGWKVVSLVPLFMCKLIQSSSTESCR
jgi:hypothetical protein